MQRIGPTLLDGAVAGVAAGVLSGIPSTLHALVTGRDPVAAVRAAGSLLAPSGASAARLIATAPLVHGALSLGWGVLLAAALPRRRAVAWGTAAGLAIAALDLGLLGRRFPLVRALPLVPQVADHAAFGAVVGAVLERRRRRATRSAPPAGA